MKGIIQFFTFRDHCEVEKPPSEDYVNTFGFVMSVLKVIVGKGMLAHAYAYRLVGYEMFLIRT